MLQLTINGVTYKGICLKRAYELCLKEIGPHAELFALGQLKEMEWFYFDQDAGLLIRSAQIN